MLVAGLAAAALLIAELACRWWVRRRSGYYVWAPGTRFYLRLDHGIFPEVERPVRFEVNADGERGADLPDDDDEAGLYRILVAGGSAVECFALDQETSWPGALERLLAAPDALDALGARKVHVGSIGRSNVASADLDLILARVLPRYRRLAAIIIMVGAGEVVQWLEEGAPPSLSPVRIPTGKVFTWHPERPFGWKPKQWGMVEVARRLRRLWLRPWSEEESGAWYAAARRMRAEAKEMRTDTPDPTPMVDRFEHHLRQLLRRAKAHADRVIVVRQPWFEKDYTAEEVAHFWHGGVGKAWREKITVYYGLEVVNRLMGLVDARTATVAESCGVEQLDLQPVLQPSLRNYFDYTHFTPAGAAVVAQAVATAVLAPSALPARPHRPARAASVAAAASPGSADS
jgi:lysophospholipase L1-like esterase